MQMRAIGDLEVSLLGLGTSRLASMGAGRSKSDARRLLGAARDCGVNVLDTADTYGSTAAERWIGELTHAEADQWIVVTKTGLPTADFPGLLRAANQPAKKVVQRVRPGFHVDWRGLRSKIERSLRRLRRDRIDIYLLHLPPVGIEDDDALHGVLLEAVQSGLIRQFGVSSNDVDTLRAIESKWGVACAETMVNPASAIGRGDVDLGRFDLIANHVAGVTSQSHPGMADRLHDEAGARHAQLLRHAAAVPGVKVVLTGTSNVQHLRANAAALERPSTAADLLTQGPGVHG